MCIKLVIWKSLYYDARSEKHQIEEKCLNHFVRYVVRKEKIRLVEFLEYYLNLTRFNQKYTLPFSCSGVSFVKNTEIRGTALPKFPDLTPWCKIISAMILMRINEPAVEEHHRYRNYSTNEVDLQCSKPDFFFLVGYLGM